MYSVSAVFVVDKFWKEYVPWCLTERSWNKKFDRPSITGQYGNFRRSVLDCVEIVLLEHNIGGEDVARADKEPIWLKYLPQPTSSLH